MSKEFKDIKIEPMPGSQVKITGEIHAEIFEMVRKLVLENVVATTEISGFRTGKAPEALVLKHVGEGKILERAAEQTINDAYGKILDEHNVRAIGSPAVSITKLAAGNPLGFSIITSVMPEIQIANYKDLAKKALAKVPNAPEHIEEKEVDAVIEDVRKHLAQGKEELPEFNDDTVKKLGDFENVADFREKAKKNILEHKKSETHEKRRGAIAETLIEHSSFEIPKLIVESELEQMMGQFKADIQRNGFTFEEYLIQIKKTEDEIRKEWLPSAEKRARLELILKHIGRAEKITLSEEEVKKEVDHIVSHHKTADRFRARMYVENLLTNKKVFELLEKA